MVSREDVFLPKSELMVAMPVIVITRVMCRVRMRGEVSRCIHKEEN
jgi:hypothetical protein